ENCGARGGCEDWRKRFRAHAAMVSPRAAQPFAGNGAKEVSDHSYAQGGGEADPQGRVRKRALCRLRTGARNERRPAAAGALGRQLSDAVSNPPPGADCNADRLCHGAHGGAVHKTFSTRFGGGDGPGGAAVGREARHSGGSALAGFPDRAEDYAAEEKRRRGILVRRSERLEKAEID